MQNTGVTWDSARAPERIMKKRGGVIEARTDAHSRKMRSHKRNHKRTTENVVIENHFAVVLLTSDTFVGKVFKQGVSLNSPKNKQTYIVVLRLKMCSFANV